MSGRVISKEEAGLRETLLSLPWATRVVDFSPAGQASSDDLIFIMVYGKSEDLSYYVSQSLSPDSLAVEGIVDRIVSSLEAQRERLLRGE